jgi:peptidoglycan L-alanyl-D-glutamate endopeptidase CwlK
MDKITLTRIDKLNIRVREEASEIYKEICESLTGRAKCRFTHTLRTFEEQNALYAQGRSRPGKIVTNARGGQSYHNYGVAIDICLIIDGKEASWDTLGDYDGDHVSDWQEIVRIFKMYGWEYGGDWKFKDYPHFQKTLGMSIKDWQRIMPNGLR